MAAAPASVGAVPAKLKIRIKGLSVLGAKQKAQQQQVSTGFPNGLPAVIGDQLADLHAAVEAFSQQGLRGLPGAVLLSPWREPPPVEQLAPWGEPSLPQEQQGNAFSSHAQQSQQQYLQEQQGLPLQPGQQPAQRRVRKRRAPDPQSHAGDGAAADRQDLQHLAWGNLKRQRTSHQRAARDTAQLSTSIHSMLHAASGDAAAAPASPSVVSQPRAAGTAAGAHAPARSGGKAVAAAGAQQPSRLQRSSSRLASPAQAAAAEPDTPAAQDYAASAAPAAGKPDAVAAQAMDCDDPCSAAGEMPIPATSGAAAEPGGAAKQQQEQQQELRQQESYPQQQMPQRQETMQEPQAEAKKVQQQQQKQPGRKQQQKPLPPRKQKQQQVVKQEQQKPLVSRSAAAVRATASQVEAEQPAVVAAVSGPAAPAAAAADLKPESPPSETSHQQHMPEPQQLQQQLLPCTAEQQPVAAAVQQQQQEHESPAAPDLQVEQPIKQPEQTAVSRDRSQCSLPRGPDPSAGAAAVSRPAPVAAAPAALNAAGGSSSTAGAAGRSSGRLLELAPGAMTPAARALAMLSAVPEVRQRVLPPEDRPVRTQEEAQAFLQTILDKAKQLKHQGDRRHNSVNGWDVFGLSFYALSSVEFLMYWDTLLRLLNKLRAANQPVDKLQQLVYSLSSGVNPFLRQTGSLSVNGMSACSNCKGPDMAKMALRMLLERISAISALRNLHNQRKQLESHIRLLKSNGASYNSGSDAAGSSVRSAAAPPQPQPLHVAAAQQQAVRLQASRAGAATAAPSAGKPPSPNGSSWSPAGAGGAQQQQQQQQFNKRSPDDSNASNQDRVHLPVGGEHVSGVAGGAGAAAGGGAAQGGQTERALALAKSERALMDSMQELLKLTDSMHQTVMRIQQFLERPEVLASEHARAAALHISVLGLDAGMFSIPRVAAHTEAAVTCILKLLRSS